MNSVYETDVFTKAYEASEKSEQLWIDRIKEQLAENLEVGNRCNIIGFVRKSWAARGSFSSLMPEVRKLCLLLSVQKRSNRK